MVESLKRVDGLRGGLKDVDEPLVGADLEVLARVLVLERAADHAVAVLLGGQRNGTGHRRAGALRGLDDLAGRLLDGRVVIGLQPDPDLVLSECCHGGKSLPVDVLRAGLLQCEGPPPESCWTRPPTG